MKIAQGFLNGTCFSSSGLLKICLKVSTADQMGLGQNKPSQPASLPIRSGQKLDSILASSFPLDTSHLIHQESL